MFRDAESRYLAWIHTVRGAKPALDLTNSGLRTPLASLGVDPASLLQALPEPGGDPVVRELVAARYGVDREEVLGALGTSLGLFLAMAATLGPGDRVLVEEPGYEPLIRIPAALGAEVARFPRTSGSGWRVDPEAVLCRTDPRTRLVVVSDLHNPSGRSTGELQLLVRALQERGIALLVDEVYRDFQEGPVGTARTLGPDVMAVSSLTKVYGLGELRAGWVLASPARVARMRGVQNLLHVVDPGPPIPLARAALGRAEAIREEAFRRARAGWATAAAWLAARDDVSAPVPEGCVHFWLRLGKGRTGSRVSEELLARFGVAVVPGWVFGDDGGLRIGFGADPERLGEGLEALGAVLDDDHSEPRDAATPAGEEPGWQNR